MTLLTRVKKELIISQSKVANDLENQPSTTLPTTQTDTAREETVYAVKFQHSLVPHADMHKYTPIHAACTHIHDIHTPLLPPNTHVLFIDCDQGIKKQDLSLEYPSHHVHPKIAGAHPASRGGRIQSFENK